MSLQVPAALGAARATAVAIVALVLAVAIVRWLSQAQGRTRVALWTMLLAPLFTPALLVSYTYSRLAFQFVAMPPAQAALYFCALTVKLVPVATVILYFLPPALSPEATHAHALLRPGRLARWRFLVRGAGQGPWLAGGLVFLLAFTDFELASLWSWKTWPVMLFDAQVGGMSLLASLRLAAIPLAIEVLVLLLLLRAAHLPHGATGHWKILPPVSRLVLGIYLAVAVVLGCLWPLGLVTTQALAGWRTVAANFVLSRELLVSCAFAAGAVLLAWPLAGLVRRRSAALVLALPGLLGALLLALFLLALFHVPIFRPAYDTPIPLLLALTLLLLPLALPLRRLLDALRQNPALHLARLARRPALVWQLDGRRRWLAAALLFCWAWSDFTAGSLLAPVGLTPVLVRLHNLAHYGQTAVLSAMLAAAFLAPVAVLLLTAPLARWYPRLDGR